MKKLVAVYKAFRGGEWFRASLESIADHVDGIVVIQSTQPWSGDTTQEENTSEVLTAFAVDHPELFVVTEIFNHDDQGRQYARALDIVRQHWGETETAILVIDTDEVWPTQDISCVSHFIKTTDHDYYAVRLYDYVKSPLWRADNGAGYFVIGLGSPNPPEPCRARFAGWNEHDNYGFADDTRLHHFTMVREDASEIRAKCANVEYLDGQYHMDWFERVWDKLPEGVNLHPTPNWEFTWPCIRTVRPSQLPDAVMQDPRASAIVERYAQNTSPRTVADVIQGLINKHEYKSYLEIGLDDGETFRSIECCHKAGVDPATADGGYQMTADQFWEDMLKLKGYPYPFDIILVDGDHRWSAALRDVSMALRYLASNGTVVMHDIMPRKQEHADLTYRNQNGHTVPGNGSAWKAWAILRMSRPDLVMRSLNLGDGFGFISPRHPFDFRTDLWIPDDECMQPHLFGPDHDLTWSMYCTNFNDIFKPMTPQEFKTWTWDKENK